MLVIQHHLATATVFLSKMLLHNKLNCRKANQQQNKIYRHTNKVQCHIFITFAYELHVDVEAASIAADVDKNNVTTA
jgi:hypothetical protein